MKKLLLVLLFVPLVSFGQKNTESETEYVDGEMVSEIDF